MWPRASKWIRGGRFNEDQASLYPTATVGSSAVAHSFGEPKSFDRLQRSDLSPDPMGVGNNVALVRRQIDGVISSALRQHVARPVAEAIESLARSPAGTAVLSTIDGLAQQGLAALTQAAQSPLGRVVGALYGQTLGRVLDPLVEHTLANPAFWERLEAGARTVAGGIRNSRLATVAAIAIANDKGTLVSGLATVGGDGMTPQAEQVARALNLPDGTTFNYYYAPLPGLESLGGRALFAWGLSGPSVLPPATQPGQSGVAQPWGGYNQRQQSLLATITASVVGAGSYRGFSIGTPNFNIGDSNFESLGRVVLSGPRVELLKGMRKGGHPVDLSAHVSADLAARGHNVVMNLGPLAVNFDRLREPISVKARAGTSPGLLDLTAQGIPAEFSPVLPLSGSTTYDPNAPDIKFLGEQLDKLQKQLKSLLPQPGDKNTSQQAVQQVEAQLSDFDDLLDEAKGIGELAQQIPIDPVSDDNPAGIVNMVMPPSSDGPDRTTEEAEPEPVQRDGEDRVVLPATLDRYQAEQVARLQSSDVASVWRAPDGREFVWQGRMPAAAPGSWVGEGFGLRGLVSQPQSSGASLNVRRTPGVQLLTYESQDGDRLGARLLERLEAFELAYGVQLELTRENIVMHFADGSRRALLRGEPAMMFAINGGANSVKEPENDPEGIIRLIDEALEEARPGLAFELAWHQATRRLSALHQSPVSPTEVLVDVLRDSPKASQALADLQASSTPVEVTDDGAVSLRGEDLAAPELTLDLLSLQFRPAPVDRLALLKTNLIVKAELARSNASGVAQIARLPNSLIADAMQDPRVHRLLAALEDLGHAIDLRDGALGYTTAGSMQFRTLTSPQRLSSAAGLDAAGNREAAVADMGRAIAINARARLSSNYGTSTGLAQMLQRPSPINRLIAAHPPLQQVITDLESRTGGEAETLFDRLHVRLPSGTLLRVDLPDELQDGVEAAWFARQRVPEGRDEALARDLAAALQRFVDERFPDSDDLELILASSTAGRALLATSQSNALRQLTEQGWRVQLRQGDLWLQPPGDGEPVRLAERRLLAEAAAAQGTAPIGTSASQVGRSMILPRIEQALRDHHPPALGAQALGAQQITAIEQVVADSPRLRDVLARLDAAGMQPVGGFDTLEVAAVDDRPAFVLDLNLQQSVAQAWREVRGPDTRATIGDAIAAALEAHFDGPEGPDGTGSQPPRRDPDGADGSDDASQRSTSSDQTSAGDEQRSFPETIEFERDPLIVGRKRAVDDAWNTVRQFTARVGDATRNLTQPVLTPVRETLGRITARDRAHATRMAARDRALVHEPREAERIAKADARDQARVRPVAQQWAAVQQRAEGLLRQARAELQAMQTAAAAGEDEAAAQAAQRAIELSRASGQAARPADLAKAARVFGRSLTEATAELDRIDARVERSQTRLDRLIAHAANRREVDLEEEVLFTRRWTQSRVEAEYAAAAARFREMSAALERIEFGVLISSDGELPPQTQAERAFAQAQQLTEDHASVAQTLQVQLDELRAAADWNLREMPARQRDAAEDNALMHAANGWQLARARNADSKLVSLIGVLDDAAANPMTEAAHRRLEGYTRGAEEARQRIARAQQAMAEGSSTASVELADAEKLLVRAERGQRKAQVQLDRASRSADVAFAQRQLRKAERVAGYAFAAADEADALAAQMRAEAAALQQASLTDSRLQWQAEQATARADIAQSAAARTRDHAMNADALLRLTREMADTAELRAGATVKKGMVAARKAAVAVAAARLTVQMATGQAQVSTQPADLAAYQTATRLNAQDVAVTVKTDDGLVQASAWAIAMPTKSSLNRLVPGQTSGAIPYAVIRGKDRFLSSRGSVSAGELGAGFRIGWDALKYVDWTMLRAAYVKQNEVQIGQLKRHPGAKTQLTFSPSSLVRVQAVDIGPLRISSSETSNRRQFLAGELALRNGRPTASGQAGLDWLQDPKSDVMIFSANPDWDYDATFDRNRPFATWQGAVNLVVKPIGDAYKRLTGN